MKEKAESRADRCRVGAQGAETSTRFMSRWTSVAVGDLACTRHNVFLYTSVRMWNAPDTTGLEITARTSGRSSQKGVGLEGALQKESKRQTHVQGTQQCGTGCPFCNPSMIEEVESMGRHSDRLKCKD